MKSDKQRDLYFEDHSKPITFDRRKFIKSLGSGVIVTFSLNKLSFLEEFGKDVDENIPEFNAYLRIKEDGRVDCYTGKIEMGQGVITSLAQVLAEELEVPITSVDMVMGDTELCPYDAGTWGSLTTRFTDPVIRAAAAEAREVLKELAAEKFGVDIGSLEAWNGTVHVKGDPGKKISYAELTEGKKIVRSLSKKPEIKKANEFKLIGKPIISVDAVAKVTGKAKYSADIRLPGMVYASVVRPKVFGSKKLSVDASALDVFEGVELVNDGDLVAVVHPDPEVAYQAAHKVKVTWDAPKAKANNNTIFSYFENNIKNSDVFEEGGNLENGKKAADKIISGRYEDGYVAHASMEPHVATCYFEGDKLIMWASTQTPFGTRQQVADMLKVPVEKVHVKQIFLGGGFGGKGSNQQALEAAKIAKITQKPVQLTWTRQEEFMYDRFRPAALMKITSGMDSKGKLTMWDFDIYCAGSRGTNLFYDIPNNRTRTFNERGIHPFATGAWRAPGNNSTTFARESHIDVMARAAGMDPVKFRLANMKDEDMGKTLELAVKTFKWEAPRPEGHGYGVALGFDAGTRVAMMADVHVDTNTGKVKVERIVCAQDMGQVVNPHGATIQTEGGITMGLGYALTEKIIFNGGDLETRNFNSYEITRFSRTPKIESVFIDKMDSKPQGGGEPAIICVGAAIANAVFDACGARVTQMPLTPEKILDALSKK